MVKDMLTNVMTEMVKAAMVAVLIARSSQDTLAEEDLQDLLTLAVLSGQTKLPSK